LRPDRQVELERERNRRPVVGVAGCDPAFGRLAVILVISRRLLRDRHDLEGSKEESLIQPALGGQARYVAGDLLGDCLRTDAPRALRRGDNEAGTAADQRR